MTTASRFVRKQLAQLPKKYARLSMTSSPSGERKPAIFNESSVIERQFLEYIETSSVSDPKSNWV